MLVNYFIALLAATSSGASAAVIKRQAATAGSTAPTDCVTNSVTAIGALLNNMKALSNSVCTWGGDLGTGLTINGQAQSVKTSCQTATSVITQCKSTTWDLGPSDLLANATLAIIPWASSALTCLNSSKHLVDKIPSFFGARQMVYNSLMDMNSTNTDFQAACANAVVPDTDNAKNLTKGAADIKALYTICLNTFQS